MEGIYIKEKTDDSYSGFVISYWKGGYKCSAFTACTKTFIVEHAKARGLLDFQCEFITCGNLDK